MPKIPLYQQNIQAPIQSTEAMRDPDVMRPANDALNYIGKQMAALGEKIAQKEQLAQETQYIIDRKTRHDEYEKMVSSMDDPDEIDRFYSEFIKQENEMFAKASMSRNVRDKLANDNQYFFADVNTKTNGIGGYRTQARIKKAAKPFYEAIVAAENGGSWTNTATGEVMTPEQTNEFAVTNLVELGVMKELDGMRKIAEFGSIYDYKKTDNELAHLTELYKSGEMKPDDYIVALDEKRKSLPSTRMSEDKQTLMDTQITYKIANAKQLAGKSAAFEVMQSLKDLSEGRFDDANLIRLQSTSGEIFPKAIAGAAMSMAKGEASTNGDAKKALDDLINVRNGTLSADKALKNIEKLKGQTRVVATAQIAQYAADLAKESGVATYDVFWGKNKTFKVSSRYNGFFDTIGKHLSVVSENERNEFYNSSMRALEKFQIAKPDATQEQIDQFTKEITEGNAKQIIHNVLYSGSNSGGVNVSGAWMPMNISDSKVTKINATPSPAYQRILDIKPKPLSDYKVGEKVIGANGKEFIKLGDGQWQEL